MRAELVGCGQCGRRNRLPACGRGIPRCGNCRAPLPWVTDAADDDFAEIAYGSTITVLVHVWGPWCPVCLRADPALRRLARMLAGQLKLVTVNVTRAPGLRRRLMIDSVPTLMVLIGPEIAAYHAGTPPEPSLRHWLEQARGNVTTFAAPVRSVPAAG
ncbi:MAG: thioredoxin family protein [Actinobacteria bacterium]|nr:thioredoxin family protein [Actinomycetota bacterium]